MDLVPKWKETLAEQRKKFTFECAHDARIATPDYAKHQAAYIAFNIAEKAIKALELAKVTVENNFEKVEGL